MQIETLIVGAAVVLFSLYEWRTGKHANGKKTKTDWQIGIICAIGIALQRRIVAFGIFAVMALLLPAYSGQFGYLEDAYPVACVIAFIALEEFFHGAGHAFAHTKRPKNRVLRFWHGLFRTAHRPHHLNGGVDGKGEVTTTQAFVEGWTYWFIMPNIWFSFIALYFGFVQSFLIGMTIKGLWAVHVHTNFDYDLYLLNHPNKFISKGFYALAHIFIFPNTHRHHHSRGPNSAKNLHNFFAFYDWLIYGTLVIEKERPKVCGWRQTEKEQNNAWYRFTRTLD